MGKIEGKNYFLYASIGAVFFSIGTFFEFISFELVSVMILAGMLRICGLIAISSGFWIFGQQYEHMFSKATALAMGSLAGVNLVFVLFSLTGLFDLVVAFGIFVILTAVIANLFITISLFQLDGSGREEKLYLPTAIVSAMVVFLGMNSFILFITGEYNAMSMKTLMDLAGTLQGGLLVLIFYHCYKNAIQNV